MKRITLIAVLLAQGALFAQATNGIITGRVLGTDGKPAIGVRVMVASPNANGEITAETLVAITTTDVTGRYRIENIPSGRYGIIAGVIGSPPYFPGIADGSEAKIVTIVPRSTVTGLDFSLANGSTAAQSEVGTTRFPGAETQEERRGRIEHETHIRRLLQTSPGQRIKGRVVAESGSLPPGFLNDLLVEYYWSGRKVNQYVPAFRRGGIDDSPGVGRSISVSSDGQFGVDLLMIPDDVGIALKSITTGALTGYTVRSVTLGSIDLLKENLTVTNVPAGGEILITLSPVPQTQ